MVKKIYYLFTIFLCICFFSMPLYAAEEKMTYAFDLTIDGKESKEVEKGDIITVTLKLRRTDSAEPYNMHAMQAELRYDSSFLQLIENSAVTSAGIVTKDIAMVDRYREFYMNFLSMSGGTAWNSDTLIGTVQFQVIGESGVSKITNQDFLVSFPDGSGSYECTGNEVLIILSTDCTVRFMTNGGSEIKDQIVQYGEKVIKPENPIREGFQLAGWYTDIHLTEEWDFERDTVENNMTLYAKWVPAEENNEYSGYYIIWWILLILILLIMALYYVKKKRNNRMEK